MEAGWPVVLHATRAVGTSRLKVSFWICFCDSVWRRPLFRRVWICFKDERLPACFSWGVLAAMLLHRTEEVMVPRHRSEEQEVS